MSDDYQKGWNGEPGVNNSDYAQGQSDRAYGLPQRSQPGSGYGGPSVADLGPALATPMDTTGVYNAGARFAALWRANPDQAIKETLVQLLGATIVGGLVGFGVGKLLHDDGLWLTYTKIFFWFDGFLILCFLLGVTIAGAGTKRGTLTLLFLGGAIAYMTWTYVLYPVVFVHFT